MSERGGTGDSSVCTLFLARIPPRALTASCPAEVRARIIKGLRSPSFFSYQPLWVLCPWLACSFISACLCVTRPNWDPTKPVVNPACFSIPDPASHLIPGFQIHTRDPSFRRRWSWVSDWTWEELVKVSQDSKIIRSPGSEVRQVWVPIWTLPLWTLEP